MLYQTDTIIAFINDTKSEFSGFILSHPRLCDNYKYKSNDSFFSYMIFRGWFGDIHKQPLFFP